MSIRIFSVLTALLGAILISSEAQAAMHGETEEAPSHTGSMMGGGMMGEGLMMPSMDAARGRKLFASKGCVVCHAVNGIGGEDAPPLDASTMPQMMNPFEFAAKMWRGAEAMIYLQREELGEQIELSGDELSDIIAFSHALEEQKKFSEADIPPRMKELMRHAEEEEPHEDEDAHEVDKPKE